MKKYISLTMIIVLMVAALSGCGDMEEESPSTGAQAEVSSDPTEPTLIETPTSEPTLTETPTSEPTLTETPASEPMLTETPTPEPTLTETPTPTQQPTPEPTQQPTPEPTQQPTPTPTQQPTPTPTHQPTPEPTLTPVEECSHSFSSSVVKEQTCQQHAVTLYTCTKCGYEYVEESSGYASHQCKAANVVKPTCTQRGYTQYVCSVCSSYSYYDDWVDPTGHDYSIVEVVEPTASRNGYTKHTCRYCGDYYTDNETQAHRHSYSNTGYIQPSCTEYGKIIYTCDGCGDQYTVTDYSEPPAHRYGSMYVAEAATDYSPGVRAVTCSLCGKTDTHAYALPHTIYTSSGTATVYGYWDRDWENEIFALLNEYRAQYGLYPLTMTANMQTMAHTRVAETAYWFSHDRPNGTPFYTAFPGDEPASGENIASGQRGPAQVISSWKNSTGHNELMLNSRYSYVGIGVFIVVNDPSCGEISDGSESRYKYFYVQNFSNLQ